MSTHHKRRKGDVAEVYELVGGNHTRHNPGGVGGERRITIQTGDTLHPTEAELKNFGDKFKLVVTPVTAEVEDEESPPDSVEPDGSGEPTEDSEESEESNDDASDRFDGVDFASDEAYEHARDNTDLTAVDFQDHEGTGEKNAFVEADVMAIAAGHWPGRSTFASGPAYDLWVQKGRPDMSSVVRTGHGGKTLSKSDVEGV